jgi:hypothetical protein
MGSHHGAVAGVQKPAQKRSFNHLVRASLRGLIRAALPSEDPRSTVSNLIARPERSTQKFWIGLKHTSRRLTRLRVTSEMGESSSDVGLFSLRRLPRQSDEAR